MSRKAKLILILILMVACFTCFMVIPPSALALDMNPGLKPYFLSSLALTGVTFASVEAAEGGIQSIWSNMGEYIQNKWNKVALAAQNAFIFDSVMRDSLRDWVDGFSNGSIEATYQTGGIETLYTSSHYNYSPLSSANIHQVLDNGQYTGIFNFRLNFDSITYPCQFFLYREATINYTQNILFYGLTARQQVVIDGHTVSQYQIKVQVGSQNVAQPLAISPWVTDKHIYEIMLGISTSGEVDVYVDGVLLGSKTIDGISWCGQAMIAGGYHEYWTNTIQTVPLTDQDVIINNNYYDNSIDYSGRVVNVPSTNVGDYVGENPVAVPTTDTAIPVGGVDTEIGTITGWLSQTYAKVTSGIDSFTGSVARFFDLSIPVDLSPLQIAGTTFTTKFPFSLPWDLKNAFNLMVATPVAPEWTISYMGNDISFNFDLVENYVPMIRTFMLILFDVGLILVTRKLLGGAA